jgi:SAM-dependent methyltransferase
MADQTPQDAWLKHLNEANRFNDWVASAFVDELHGAVLEVGCGIGNFTGQIASRAAQVTAVDLNPDYVRIAAERFRDRPNVRVCTADATKTDWVESFDGIVMLDVLEHVEDDVGLLQRLKQALAPDGLLVLKVPASAWLYSPMDEAIGHRRRYSRDSLALTLAAAGFTVKRQAYFNIAGMFGWWLNGKVLRHTVPPREQLALFERLVPMLRRIEGAVPWPFGLSLIAIARPAPSEAGNRA